MTDDELERIENNQIDRIDNVLATLSKYDQETLIDMLQDSLKDRLDRLDR